MATFTGMKRPVLALRPIFVPFDIHITPFPGRIGPGVRRDPNGGDDAMHSVISACALSRPNYFLRETLLLLIRAPD